MLSILLIGETDRTEFRIAKASLQRWGRVEEAATVEAAAGILAAGGFAPGVIVVAQAFPGQFSQEAIHRLRGLAPLARVFGLMGSWCEGEPRTGSPWPGVLRSYWHQWDVRCNREVRSLAQGRLSSWSLPPTATEEERLLANAATEWPKRQGLIVIDTRSAEMHAFLSTACRSRGFSTVWQNGSTRLQTIGSAAVLLDADSLGGQAFRSPFDDGRLRRVAAQFHPTPVIAILEFPRIEDLTAAVAAGAAAVLSKPLALDDLFWELDAAAGHRAA
jgi:CheY-like chemotaxis protein